jgi:hypothetical protein
LSIKSFGPTNRKAFPPDFTVRFSITVPAQATDSSAPGKPSAKRSTARVAGFVLFFVAAMATMLLDAPAALRDELAQLTRANATTASR